MHNHAQRQTCLSTSGHPEIHNTGGRAQSPIPWQSLNSILTASPIRAPLPKVEGQVSMTTEVRELLSQAVLDTSEHAFGSSTPKRLKPMVLVTPLPPKLEDFSKLVDIVPPK